MGGNELFITLPYTEFQPTHPVWGETNYTDTSRHGVTISIHPSRVGWDLVCLLPASFLMHFNPPIPCGMGLMGTVNSLCNNPFQSTHPVWDGTHGYGEQSLQQPISIHPSRVGWDSASVVIRPPTFDFNPPIPCGMGPTSQECTIVGLTFQSTHPVWDGTSLSGCTFSHIASFQSTHPVWDGTMLEPIPSPTI